MNLDGSEINHLYEYDYFRPFYVNDLTNMEIEKILLSGKDRIDVMDSDGTNRSTIIENVGNVVGFNSDRTKMLMEYSGDVYIANTDGTNLINLTNTDDLYEKHPSFSPDEEKVLYNYFYQIDDSTRSKVIAYRNFADGAEKILYQDEGIGYVGFSYQVMSNDSCIYFYNSDGVLEPTSGFYKYNMIYDNLSFIQQGIVKDIELNLEFQQVFLVIDNQLMDYDIDSGEINILSDVSTDEIVFDIDKLYLLIAEPAKIIDLVTLDESLIPKEISEPSFNKSTTRIICSITVTHLM